MPDLPSPSQMAQRIVQATQAEDVSFADLEKTIQLDPAFVARLVRVANSSRLQAGGRPTVAVKDALMVLGLAAIRSLALGFSLVDKYRSGRCQAFDYEAFWLRSLAMAQAFQQICKRVRIAPADEAFSVGLLADIGGLAFATLFPEQYGAILTEAGGEPGRSQVELERSALGLDRHELSGILLADWGLPQVYAGPVALHQASPADLPPAGSRPYLLACALSLAADMADLIVHRSQRTPEKIGELYRHGARVSLQAEEIVELGKEVARDLEEWTAAFGLPSARGMDFDWVEQATSNAHVLRQAIDDGAAKLTVLLVDDERSMRTYLSLLLQEAGYTVMAAASGKEALAAIGERRPDIVLTDWVMPEMDGLELIKRLRQSPRGDSLYTLVITARVEEDYLVQAFDAGTNDFITKPIKPRVLLSRLKAGERMVRLQRETERQYQEMRDIATELSVSNKRLQEISVTDALTGCPNRRYAVERFQQEWAASARRGDPLSCLVVDVDFFKQVNDAYGHERGDEVLKLVAETLRAGVRAEDVVCRVGGDEFWIICPGTALAAASTCGERLCAAMAAMKIPAGEQLCTISVGVAERLPGMEKPEDLIEAADRNLYRAKREGRGKVC